MTISDKICTVICKGQGISLADLKRKTRRPDIVFARQLIFYFSKELGAGSLSSISEPLGQKHSSVCHGCKTIKNYLDTNSDKKIIIDRYAKELGAITIVANMCDEIGSLLIPLRLKISEAQKEIINLQVMVKVVEDTIKKLNTEDTENTEIDPVKAEVMASMPHSPEKMFVAPFDGHPERVTYHHGFREHSF